MKTLFHIDTDNNITAVNDASEIRSPLEPGATGILVATFDDFATATALWPAARLVELWNSFAGVAGPFAKLKPVKKFMDRKTATTRIWSAIQVLEAGQGPADSGDASVLEKAPIAALAKPAAAKVKKGKPAKEAKKTPRASKPKAPVETSFPPVTTAKARVLAMIQRKSGATLPEIMKETGWQAHTVRGFMAGAMKKAGHEVESFKPEGGERTYRVAK